MKVVVTALLILGILLTPERAFPAYPLLWALIVCGSQPHRRCVWRGWALALPFVLAAAALPFTVPGQPVAHLAGPPSPTLGWRVSSHLC
ncbi:MAG: hypothetical protein U0703_20365 [Anaerolineae bacterium]